MPFEHGLSEMDAHSLPIAARNDEIEESRVQC
jgi:hypothetical protein